MTDARERAHKIAAGVSCKHPFQPHSLLCQAVASAILTARNEALEDARRVIKTHQKVWREPRLAESPCAALVDDEFDDLDVAIRALKQEG